MRIRLLRCVFRNDSMMDADDRFFAVLRLWLGVSIYPLMLSSSKVLRYTTARKVLSSIYPYWMFSKYVRPKCLRINNSSTDFRSSRSTRLRNQWRGLYLHNTREVGSLPPIDHVSTPYRVQVSLTTYVPQARS